VDDVAGVMQVASGTVKATLHQARAALAEALKENPS
jgi:DNA-directed RNA polymerase specialized sigma24 family protein